MSNQKIINNIIFNNIIDNYTINKFYQDYVLQKEYYPYQFDGWNDKKLYGLIDKQGRALYPKNNFIEIIGNTNSSTQEAFVFVGDAFNDLTKYHFGFSNTNKFEKNGSIYIDLNIQKGAINVDELYYEYMNSIYKVFYSFFALNNQTKIKNFSSFIEILLPFFKVITKFSPINRSEFIKSKGCSPNINGLNLDLLDTKVFTNTERKASTYLSDPNFDIFIDSARRFGFYVDKNIPWRLVADLESPVMKSYYRKYGLNNLDDVIKNCYHIAYYSDMDVLKSVIISFWNTYASSVVSITSQQQQQGCASLFAETNILQQFDETYFDQHFNINWLIRLYIYTRVLETKLQIKQSKFEFLFEESVKINKYVGRDQAMDYINSRIAELLNKDAEQKKNLTTPEDVIKMLSVEQSNFVSEGITF